ncbi:MAG: F0F1 ATP synthase subunit A [candidate division KSB1 bacterium]|nr:F0F1 ATP synthase subunit A [candidate division KSB1 bacterium]MDZ7302646.1 F0F1 ATP synthase subunit A [candidate division KSB1 bacterium]MDZ7311515.1 F0F1 ATP synthase subunit A [candidate division KSB1 bacterium]
MSVHIGEHGSPAEKGHDDIGQVIIHHITDSHELELPFVGVVDLPRIFLWVKIAPSEPVLDRLRATAFSHTHLFRFGKLLTGITAGNTGAAIDEIKLLSTDLWGIDLSITKHVVMMMLAAVLLVAVLGLMARHRRPGEIPTGFAAAIEAVVEFIRNQIAIPNMGETLGIKFTPYLCTVFFFILACNLLGLIPYASTATGNVSVTAALASLTFILIQAVGIKTNGLVGYLRHFTGGVHPLMWIIMVPVEFLGLFTKPFALCIRLYANMTAGHVVLLSLIGLIFIFGKGGANPIAGYGIAPVSIAFAVFVNLLEILVAVLQAYIFTLLSSLFIGFAAQSHHEEEGHEAHP